MKDKVDISSAESVKLAKGWPAEEILTSVSENSVVVLRWNLSPGFVNIHKVAKTQHTITRVYIGIASGSKQAVKITTLLS